MTVTYDFDELQEQHGLEVLLADRAGVRDQPVVLEPARGFSAVARGYLRVHVWELLGDDPGVQVLVEGSADGSSWATVHSWTFERDGELDASLAVASPTEYMRVTLTPTGSLRSAHVSVGFVAAYVDAPSGGGGGGGGTPGDRPPTWGTTTSTHVIAQATIDPVASTTAPIEPLTQDEIDAGYTQEVLVEVWGQAMNFPGNGVQALGFAIVRGNMPPADAYGSFQGDTTLEQFGALQVDLADTDGSGIDVGSRPVFAYSLRDFNPVGSYGQFRYTQGDPLSGGASILFKALEPGAAGNDFSIEAVGAVGDQALSVSVAGAAITVHLATTSGTPTSTFLEVQDAVNQDPEASLLIVASADAGLPDVLAMDPFGPEGFLEGNDTVYYSLWSDGGNSEGQVLFFGGIRTTTVGIAP